MTPFNQGENAYEAGYNLSDNPYKVDTQSAWDWENGWISAEADDDSSTFTYDHEYDGWWTP